MTDDKTTDDDSLDDRWHYNYWQYDRKTHHSHYRSSPMADTDDTDSYRYRHSLHDPDER